MRAQPKGREFSKLRYSMVRQLLNQGIKGKSSVASRALIPGPEHGGEGGSLAGFVGGGGLGT